MTSKACKVRTPPLPAEEQEVSHPSTHEAAGAQGIIRAIRPTEVDVLAQLCAEHAAYEGALWRPRGQTIAWNQALFSPPPRLFAWGLDVAGNLEGFATASLEYSTWQAREFLHLDCLYLRPAQRRQGWGRRFLETVSDRARTLGCRQVQWQTPPWNTSAIAFYETQGAVGLEKVRFTLQVEG